jgi:hypothetical protein
MQLYWVLQVSIPLSRPEGAWGLADELERALGPHSSSGIGFGNRDIDWSFLSEEMANEAEEKALAFFSERIIPTNDDDSDGDPVQVDVTEYDNVDDDDPTPPAAEVAWQDAA